MRTGNPKIAPQITAIEPEITLLDDGKFLRVLAEMPGIPEEKIKINLDNSSTSITIVASDTVKEYKKVITIPREVSFSKKRFSNGVLELTLEKTNSGNL